MPALPAINIPTGSVNRVRDAFKATYIFPDPAFPGETVPDFIKRKLLDYMKSVVKEFEGAAARTTSDANVDSTLGIT